MNHPGRVTRAPPWRHVNLALGAILIAIVILAAAASYLEPLDWPYSHLEWPYSYLGWLHSYLELPYSADEMDVPSRLQGPSAAHWLGTDQFGRDVAVRIIVGARNSIAVGLVAVGIGIAFGVTLGAWAAARRGWVDEAVMRAGDVIFAFPAIISAVLITAYLGPGAVNAMIAIGIFNVPVFARVTRGAALQVWGLEYTRAAIAIGKGPLRITVDHILPNIASVLIVQATIQFAVAILAEAALSYLGLGTQPPRPSWGRMLFDAQTLMTLSPTLAIFPGLAIGVAVLGLNMLGDGLRDALDPRLKLLRMR